MARVLQEFDVPVIDENTTWREVFQCYDSNFRRLHEFLTTLGTKFHLDTFTGISGTELQLTQTYVPGTNQLLVYRNGVAQWKDVDYREVSISTIELVEELVPEDEVRVIIVEIYSRYAVDKVTLFDSLPEPTEEYAGVFGIVSSNKSMLYVCIEQEGEWAWVECAIGKEATLIRLVNQYLDAHPELTTTVSDNSISPKKLMPHLRKSITKGYDNIEAMKVDLNLEDGMFAVTGGGVTIGDGNGGAYRIYSTAPDEPYVTLNNGLYAKLINYNNLKKDGDISDTVLGDAEQVVQELPMPVVNDTFKKFLGKIIKFCTDIKRVFQGSLVGADGRAGLVPPPDAGDPDRFLKCDGSWEATVKNLNEEFEGSVLDASMGKELNDKKVDKINVVNNLTTNVEGYVLDARQGKALNEKIVQRIDISGVTGMQVRGSTLTNNLAFRVYKNANNTAWTQETINADNATITIAKREEGGSTDTVVATIYSAGAVLKRVDYSYEYTVAANASVSITGAQFGVSTPSGYYVVGVVSWFTGNQYVFAYRITPQNTGAQTIISMHNTANSSISVTATITILYAKTIMNG